MAKRFVHNGEKKFCSHCGSKLTDEHVSSEYDDQTGELIEEVRRKVCPWCEWKEKRPWRWGDDIPKLCAARNEL